MRQSRVAFVLFGLIALLMAFDIYEDLHEGTTLAHVAVESPIMILALCGIGRLWLDAARRRRELAALGRDLQAARDDARQWAARARPLLQGLASEIDAQFSSWSLTRAESEVALLILKGYRFEEIAAIRDVSERTARQQALAIYRKAGIHGRTELTAYFLEDLLLPVEDADAPQASAAPMDRPRGAKARKGS